jgi:HPt (histidine-containing phosphotransfer) domain-containing protein
MFLTSGFQDFLSKPIDIAVLDHILKRWVRNKNLEGPGGLTSIKQLDSNSQGSHNFNQEIDPGAPATTQALPKPEIKIEIPGLNPDVCLGLFNNDLDDYIKFITFFADNTLTKLESIKTISSDSLHDYAVVVHGIKGSCAWIGADKIKKAAEELEKLALAGDLDTVLIKNPSFIQCVTTLIENIKLFCDHQKNHG